MLLLHRLMSFSVRSFEAPLAADRVGVSLSSRFNRRAHPDPSVERQRTQSWEERKRETPRLFNATKFRLQGLAEDHHSRSLQLQWGLTDYASYLGTCCSALAPQLLADGERLHGDGLAFLSRKVGVAAVLETRDGQVALIQRSKSVGLYQDLYDTPGGHPEPSSIQLTEDVLKTLEDTSNELRRTQLEHAAKQEFFQSIVSEVHEEVNLAPQQQQPPMLLGVVLQTDACTPSFSFHVKAECSAQELRELYRAGPSDKFESVKLKLLSAESLLAEGSTTLDELKLTPSAKGTLGLWQQHTLRARQQQ
ncbi:nudix (nucleoside diphosphate linked moiety X)-type motif 22 [Phytophthora pseudosyringae]|uniref:Nudix (Nucleoside diphosphate linked moiety X)-type motif 22 n=1 Tax=Phytophthora pseudosyringae TaxID=221518 RepID=A0A8T1W4W0_9STRA|nr:nudix (nucleoside diphosphate linked moiety X)-type motif 22 [Phytophthora pseudosyringae]